MPGRFQVLAGPPLLFSLLLACSAVPAARPPVALSAPAAAEAEPRTGQTVVEAADTSGTEARAENGERDEESDEGEGEDEDDDGEDQELPATALVALPHPLAALSAAELDHRVATELASLGPMSIGKPSGGFLVNAVHMPEGDEWTLADPGNAWGTDETVQYLSRAIHAVNKAFPGTPKLAIGDISGKQGGHISPHVSHQTGRDVDISFYYKGEQRWYLRGTADNLDLPRTWAFVRALAVETDVEMILIDHSIQRLLEEQARLSGEDAEWVHSLFHGGNGLPALVRHAPGHSTHIHIRFYSPIAQETGRRSYASLVAHKIVRTGALYVTHIAKKGETLVKIARRYGTTVPAIRRANGLKSNVIQAKRAYKIPHGTGPVPVAVGAVPVRIPPRRLPPHGPGSETVPKTAFVEKR